MKKNTLFILGVCFINYLVGDSAVTYHMSSGRLGDQLISYCIAKDLSLKHGIPLAYKPFSYSNQLQISAIDKELASSQLKQYKTIDIGHKIPPTADLTENNLFVVSFKHPSDY